MGSRAPLAGLRDPAEQVALVARARREMLLRAHGHRLGREDLEDCFSQATLELVARSRRGRGFASAAHIANALEQRFLSRVLDVRRALGGRSPLQAALRDALPIAGIAREEGCEPADPGGSVEERVILRAELAWVLSVVSELTPDQRLVLACQVGLQMSSVEFCRRFGWSADKFHKVGQRARARLRRLSESASGAGVGAGVGVGEERVRARIPVERACEQVGVHAIVERSE
ncbi:MAG: hypothetical protein FWD42_10270 [Solirubrobacterales bacterium]|nr:hypothetical protein [Solirubrobacterales bacterium]